MLNGKIKLNKMGIEIALVFLKLGMISFGGPAAHIAMMEREFVHKRKWINQETFMDMLGLSNLIPGPNSTEVAISIGYRRAGWLGLLLAGICFILPATLIVYLFAILYNKFHSFEILTSILYGIKPVIIAIVVMALWNLGNSAVKNVWYGCLGALLCALSFLKWSEIMLIIGTGLIVMAVEQRNKMKRIHSFMPFPILIMYNLLTNMYHMAQDIHSQGMMSLRNLFFIFLKIGSVLYGSGYVLLAFLQSDFVDKYQVISSQQLLDAVVIGQFTPGPLFTTATFIGYLIHGTEGALLATIAIFIPAFVFVALIHPWFHKLRQSVWISSFLNGVNLASFAFMALVSLQLGLNAVTDLFTCLIAVLSFYLLKRYQMNSVWLVFSGAFLGWVYQTLISS